MISENFEVFFNDFGVSCTKPDTSQVFVIFDMPDNEIFGDSIIGADIKATGKTSDFSNVSESEHLIIDSVSYYIKKIKKIDDGKIVEIFLGIA